MADPERIPPAREQIFLLAVGAFLLAYLIGLSRGHAFWWVSVVSTVTFVLAMAAGLIVTEVIAAPRGTRGAAAEPSDKGRQVDYKLDDDADEPAAEQAA